MNGTTDAKPIFFYTALNVTVEWCSVYCVLFNCPLHSMQDCCPFALLFPVTGQFPLYLQYTTIKVKFVWNETAFPIGPRALCCQLLTMPLATHKPLMSFTCMPAIFIIHIIWHSLHSHILYCCLYLLNEEKAFSLSLIVACHCWSSMKLNHYSPAWNLFTA